MRVYLAGPMRGIPNYNFPLFNVWAKALRRDGHEVFNPAELDLPQTEIRKIFAKEMKWICLQADAVALLPGWKKSRGATAERALALALGLKVIEL